MATIWALNVLAGVLALLAVRVAQREASSGGLIVVAVLFLGRQRRAGASALTTFPSRQIVAYSAPPGSRFSPFVALICAPMTRLIKP